MPDIPRGAARGWVFTTANPGFLCVQQGRFIGVFTTKTPENNRKALPVPKVRLTTVAHFQRTSLPKETLTVFIRQFQLGRISRKKRAGSSIGNVVRLTPAASL